MLESRLKASLSNENDISSKQTLIKICISDGQHSLQEHVQLVCLGSTHYCAST